jgi:DNA-binding PadR family transcriptional regulator
MTPREKIVDFFGSRPQRAFSGHEISELTKLSAGNLYPTLAQLEKDGVLISDWEVGEPPRRRLYRMAT